VFIPESAFRSPEFPPDLKPKPTPTLSTSRTTVFVAEIVCIMCSRRVGTAVDTGWPPTGSVLIQAEGSTVLRRIQLNRLYCPDCGGNTQATEVTTRLLRRERPMNWHDDQPHRGRPPKWLVEQRTAAAKLREHRGA
jgi:hypothetical protein